MAGLNCFRKYDLDISYRPGIDTDPCVSLLTVIIGKTQARWGKVVDIKCIGVLE